MRRRVALIHIAQGDDVLALHLAEVVRALAADADAGKVELLVGGGRAAQAQHAAGHHHEGGGGKGGAAQELAAGEVGVVGSRLGLHWVFGIKWAKVQVKKAWFN